MMNFLANFRALLIALWLGAACFFSFAVAPSAFGVLREAQAANAGELAGAIVNKTLMIVNLSGLVIALILIAGSFIKRKTTEAPVWIWAERFLLAVLLIACAVGQFVIGVWMSSIRTQLGKPLDELPLEEPLRIQFDNLHQYSVWMLLGAMITSLVLFFLIARKSDKTTVVEKKDEFKF